MKRTILIVGLLTAFFLTSGLVLYFFAADGLGRREGYRLSLSNITISPPPPWVPEHFTAAVLQSAGLDVDGSLLDRALAQKLAQAFEADPWVESVQRVELRYPAGAEVRLVYRAPVALVELPSEGLFPIDRNGVLLPTDYFIRTEPENRANYLRVEGIRSMPLGTVGTVWGDPIVHEAAQLAAALHDDASELELAVLRPSPVGLWTLKTRRGTEIRWGRFKPDGSDTVVKIRRLHEIAELYRSLDDVPANSRPIDLTTR